jgi:hypothetical protein
MTELFFIKNSLFLTINGLFIKKRRPNKDQIFLTKKRCRMSYNVTTYKAKRPDYSVILYISYFIAPYIIAETKAANATVDE